MAAMKINLTKKLMCTTSVNVERGCSYEKFSIYHTKVSYFKHNSMWRSALVRMDYDVKVRSQFESQSDQHQFFFLHLSAL